MKKTLIPTLVLAAVALAVAAVALAGGSRTTSATSPAPRTPETSLTGDTLAKASAAAIAKVGGTVDAATTENDGSSTGAAYEVHVTKADGTHVTVLLDSSYAVLAVEAGRPRDGHGRFGRFGPPPGFGGPRGPGGNGETPLTGDTATQANAAAVAKVGGTADFATTENDGTSSAAAYEVHVTKTDGSHVTVILDKSFAVLSVETGGPHH